MKKTVIKENFAFIYFHSSFYTKKAILSAMHVYKDYFKSSVADIGKYFVVKIDKINENFSLKELTDEFSNYVLSNEMSLEK